VQLLYLHGSSLQSFFGTGKVHFLDALNPGGLFEWVHMVNVDTRAQTDLERDTGAFRFTAIGLSRHGSTRWGRLRVLWQAVDSLAKGRPSLVLADDANLLGLTALLISRRTKAPYAICIYYDNDLHYRLTGQPALAFLKSRRVEAALERLVLRGAKGVYAQTRGYRDYGLRHGGRPDRTYLGSWSVDDVFYKEPVAPHPDSRELLCIARLHPLKFLEDVVAAVALLRRKVRLDLAGEGPEQGRLEALVAAYGLEGRVRLLGLIPREEVLARMQGARVLLVTQGFSAAVESLLSGRPVVAYDHECNTEVVRNHETGLVVPFRDVSGLAKAIDQILADPELGESLGLQGRLKMLEECRIATSIEHRRRFLTQCLEI